MRFFSSFVYKINDFFPRAVVAPSIEGYGSSNIGIWSALTTSLLNRWF